MRTYSQSGWLPVELYIDPQPAVVSDGSIRWVEIGERPFTEPFFGGTVDELRATTRPPREIDASLETLLRVGAKLPPIQPAGFIFHISHCGSTLVSNVLKTASSPVTVASEPSVIAWLARRFAPYADHYLEERWRQRQRALLQSCFTLFGHHRTGEPDPLIIKFSSLNTMEMGRIRQWWPKTPAVVLVRDPTEVMVSALREPGWVGWKEDRPEMAREFFDLDRPLEPMPNEQYCARVLGQLFIAALPALDANCKVIDYEDLSPKRLREIAEFFQVELPPAEEINRTFTISAKDPKRVFRNDHSRKQSLVTSAMREAAAEWAWPAYNALRGAGFW